MKKKKWIIFSVVIMAIILILIFVFLSFFVFGTKAKNIKMVKKILEKPENYKTYYEPFSLDESKIYEIDDGIRDAILNELKDMEVRLSYVYLLRINHGRIREGHLITFEDKMTGEQIKISLFPYNLYFNKVNCDYCDKEAFEKIDNIFKNLSLTNKVSNNVN